MGQMLYAQNFNFLPSDSSSFTSRNVYFLPMHFPDNISFNTLNFLFQGGYNGQNCSFSFSFGLYSLTGSTLTLVNWISKTAGFKIAPPQYLSATATSSAQNITPGTWFIGMFWDRATFTSTAAFPDYVFWGNTILNGWVTNNFPAGFIGGRMSVTTNALPATVATSDVDTANADAMMQNYIIISA
jgi:hypothetical protein